jgi:hypothetical protein
MSCAPIFIISSEVKAENWYDVSERPMAIAPINIRTRALVLFESLWDTIKDKGAMRLDKSTYENIL